MSGSPARRSLQQLQWGCAARPGRACALRRPRCAARRGGSRQARAQVGWGRRGGRRRGAPAEQVPCSASSTTQTLDVPTCLQAWWHCGRLQGLARCEAATRRLRGAAQVGRARTDGGADGGDGVACVADHAADKARDAAHNARIAARRRGVRGGALAGQEGVAEVGGHRPGDVGRVALGARTAASVSWGSMATGACTRLAHSSALSG